MFRGWEFSFNAPRKTNFQKQTIMTLLEQTTHSLNVAPVWVWKSFAFVLSSVDKNQRIWSESEWDRNLKGVVKRTNADGWASEMTFQSFSEMYFPNLMLLI